jgi:peptidoglycan hydrolase-like protein with peptidoglycan-binding domain
MSKLLGIGSTGSEVSAVQTELNRSIVPPLKVDGIYGPKTEKAVRHFQKAVGFHGRDVDGVVGPKTTTALFQVFDMKISGNLIPRANSSTASSFPTGKPAVVNRTPAPTLAPSPSLKANDPTELPKRFQSTLQFGFQDSNRDGRGLQAQLGFTFRTRDYYPNSGVNTIYHGMHWETMFAPVLGIPLPSSMIYTGQIGVTVQPVTDWFVLSDRLHLLTPSIGFYGQIPMNHPNATTPSKDDPASHPRLGGFIGLELFHLDIVKDRLAIGISGQESAYWDFKDRKVIWDPSVLGFLQITFGSWSQYKPLPKP